MGEALIEPFAAPEFFVDGFDDYEVRDGILTCAGFRLQHGERVAVVHIVMPVKALNEMIALAMQAAAPHLLLS